MKKEKCLPLQMLKLTSSKYPSAWSEIESARENRNWPDWCYVPINRCLTITMASQANVFQQVQDAVLMSAQAPWRISKEIYVFDNELANDLYSQPLDKLPTVVFERLPFPAIYIQAPGLGVNGFFVSREYDVKNKAVELRFTFCNNTAEAWPAFIAYDSASTIKEAVDKMSLGRENPRLFDMVKKAMQLTLYLCTSNPEVSPRQNQFKRPASHPKDSYREIRTWDVGLRYGAAIKQYKQTNKTRVGSHTGKRPHYRRGHFQHYWRGPRDGERTLEFIWIDPILVNADKVDRELPAVIHEVKDND